MTDSTVFNLNKPELNDPLQEILREGARKMLSAAIESEVAAFIQQHGGLKTDDGKKAIVRNGYLPERTIQTGLGGIEVKVPKVRDRCGSSIKFNSSLIPPYLKRTKNKHARGQVANQNKHARGQVANQENKCILQTMSRPLRLEFPNALYHVTSRGDRRENIYEDDDDRLRFLEILGTVVADYNWLCHGYCLMDNHYHLIIETPDGNLSKGMRQLNGVYTQASNRRHGRSGHLFQGRYKAILVDKDRYLLELSRYVVLNPLRAKGMVNRLEDWPWSSYLAIVGDAPKPEWLTTDWILSLFGKRKKIAMERYRQFVLEGVQQQPEIWSNLKGQIFLGDEAYVTEMQKKIGKERDDLNIPRPQKRPVAKPLSEIAAQYKDRNTAIIAAYKTGAYSQREIGEFYQLHPTTIGVIIRKNRDA